MKKKIWLLPLLILTLLSGVLLTSCSDDDDEQSSVSIVGTWRSNYEDGILFLTFAKTGTFTSTFYDTKEDYEDTNSGTYTLRDSQLTIRYNLDPDYDVATIISLTDTSLLLRWEGWYDEKNIFHPEVSYEELTRVK